MQTPCLKLLKPADPPAIENQEREPEYVDNSVSYVDNVDLNFSVSLVPYLLYCLEKRVRQALNDIKSENKETYKLHIYLNCEFNYNVHLIEVTPKNSQYLNLVFIYESIEKQLQSIDLANNPIVSFELEMHCEQPVTGKAKNWYKKKVSQVAKPYSFLDSPIEIDFLTEDLPSSLYEEDKIYMDGKQLDLKLPESLPANNQHSIREFDSLVEIAPSQLSQYKFVSRAEQSLFGLNDSFSYRGRNYFIAVNPQGRKFCILFDSIENKYFLMGQIE